MTRRWFAVLLAIVVGCKPQPPERLPRVRKQPHPFVRDARYAPLDLREFVATPLPIVADALLPELVLERRWPLPITVHPELDPHYPIAAELAEPGLGWLDLCRLGAQNRHLPGKDDQLAYLSGWCKVAKGDNAAAIELWAPLLRSAVRDLPHGVRLDIASLVMADRTLRAFATLDRMAIADPELGDVLAAFSFDANLPADAGAYNAYASDNDATPSAATRCRRLARRVLTFDAVDPLKVVEQMKTYVAHDCVQLAAALSCKMFLDGEPRGNCVAYAAASRRPMAVYNAYALWPRSLATRRDWLRILNTAVGGLHDPDAQELADAALDSVFHDLPCLESEREHAHAQIRAATFPGLSADAWDQLRAKNCPTSSP
jgi:hypothetical protein